MFEEVLKGLKMQYLIECPKFSFFVTVVFLLVRQLVSEQLTESRGYQTEKDVYTHL